MHSRLTLLLLARRAGPTRHQQAGFALLLSLFVGLAVVIGWLMLAARTSSSRLGAALQSENREARLVAESGVDAVISQLNQPRNRILLAQGTSLGEWQSSERYRNLCNNASRQPPSTTIAQLGNGTYFDLPAVAANDRFTRRYRLKQVSLKDKDRNPRELGSRSPINLAQRGAVGYIELEIEGQLLRNGTPAATAFIKREYQVVPKCCERSFRGPGVDSGPYGTDNRFCPGFPQFLVGTGNSQDRTTGGMKVNGNDPELRSRESEGEDRPEDILCYTTTGSCPGVAAADGVPVVTTDQEVPKVPVLGVDGTPCDDQDAACIEAGINKARTGGFTARPIDLITQIDTQNDPKTDKDYIRVNSQGQVEICNKQSSPEYVSTPISQLSNQQKRDIKQSFDKNPTIIPGSCEPMMGTNDESKDVCAEKNVDGKRTYHCRIRNIFVNDTGNVNAERDVRQNNTLFIDTSNGPIYLYVNEDWAATTREQASQAVKTRLARMTTASFTPPDYRAIYTVGNFNDGQIQHVYCDSPSDTQACTREAPFERTSQASIISACRRKFNQEKRIAEEDCQGRGPDGRPNGTNTVNAVIGDDGFVRDVFFYMPNSTLTINGDPVDENDAQGKPQVAAAVWVDNLEFNGRSTELWAPGGRDDFYGLEISPLQARYTPVIFDYIARNVTNSFLFRP